MCQLSSLSEGLAGPTDIWYRRDPVRRSAPLSARCWPPPVWAETPAVAGGITGCYVSDILNSRFRINRLPPCRFCCLRAVGRHLRDARIRRRLATGLNQIAGARRPQWLQYRARPTQAESQVSPASAGAEYFRLRLKTEQAAAIMGRLLLLNVE